jgi:hypothetical protein
MRAKGVKTKDQEKEDYEDEYGIDETETERVKELPQQNREPIEQQALAVADQFRLAGQEA